MPANIVVDASAFGAGRHTRYTDFNHAALESVAVAGVGSGFPGMVWAFQGELYQIVQNRFGNALEAGDSVSLLVGDAARTGNLTGASTKAIVTTDDTLDANLQGSRSYPGVIGTTTGALATTADMEQRQIIANSTTTNLSTVTVSTYQREDGPNNDATTGPNAYGTLLDANADYQIVTGWEVTKLDVDALVTTALQGVVVTTSITDNYFGIIQISGVALAKVDGTTDLVAGDLLIPDAGAGVLSKWVVGAPDAAGVTNSNYVCARILAAYTANSVGKRLVELLNRPRICYPIL